MRIPRTRGAVSGLLLIALGLWGALIPLVGPSFHFGVQPDKSWDLTTGRLLLEVLPGAAAVVGGLLLLTSAHRARAALGAWLGIAAGAWFAIGPTMSTLWNHGTSQAGAPIGTGSGRIALEQLALFEGLGALMVALAAFGLGRLAVRSVRDVELARAATAADGRDDDVTVAPGRRFRREGAATDDDRTAVAPAGTADDRTAVTPAAQGPRRPE